MTAAKKPDWQPPQTDPETGRAIHGERGFSLNRRRRAEEIATAGLVNDPDGLVTPELIADAKARLAAIKSAEKATPAPAASKEA